MKKEDRQLYLAYLQGQLDGIKFCQNLQSHSPTISWQFCFLFIVLTIAALAAALGIYSLANNYIYTFM